MERRQIRAKHSQEAATPRKQKRTGGYSYYLQDRPFLAPAITLLLGGICLYITIFSNLLRDAVIGANADLPKQGNFNMVMGWSVAFVIGIMLLSFVFLLVNAVDVIFRRARRRPAVCPRCGLAEVRGNLQFVHEPVEGINWENITCSQCGNEWHGKR